MPTVPLVPPPYKTSPDTESSNTTVPVQPLAADSAPSTRPSGNSALIVRLRRKAALTLGQHPAEFKTTTRFAEDLGFDSLDEIEFLLAVEEAFAVTFPDDIREHATTVGQLVDILVGLQPQLATLSAPMEHPLSPSAEVLALANLLNLARLQFQQEYRLAQMLELALPEPTEERVQAFFDEHSATVLAVGLAVTPRVLGSLLSLAQERTAHQPD